MFVPMCVCMYICTYECMNEYMYLCLYVCMYVCLFFSRESETPLLKHFLLPIEIQLQITINSIPTELQLQLHLIPIELQALRMVCRYGGTPRSQWFIKYPFASETEGQSVFLEIMIMIIPVTQVSTFP
jgi:hypothetical protein